jgi:hypothetical protein
VRTPVKVEDLKQAGAEVIQGDLIDPPSLARACQGADRVLAAALTCFFLGRPRLCRSHKSYSGESWALDWHRHRTATSNAHMNLEAIIECVMLNR